MGYEDGKIYTIRCKTDESLIYVGSTIQPLHQRWAGHKSNFMKGKKISFHQHIEDINDWYIELYELFPCNSKIELNKREGEIIRLIGTTNHRIEGRTEAEWRDENKTKIQQYKREYHQKNKENIAEKKHNYYLENKTKLQEYKKEWQQQNKTIIAMKRRERYLKKKEQQQQQ